MEAEELFFLTKQIKFVTEYRVYNVANGCKLYWKREKLSDYFRSKIVFYPLITITTATITTTTTIVTIAATIPFILIISTT